MVDREPIFELEVGKVDRISTTAGITSAELVTVNSNSNPFLDGLQAAQQRSCSAAYTDTTRTYGIRTVRRATVFCCNAGHRPGNPSIDSVNTNPDGPISLFQPDRLPVFTGGYGLLGAAPRSQSVFEEPSALLGVSTSLLALLRWKRKY